MVEQELRVDLQKVLDRHVVVGVEQYEQILSVHVKIGVSGHCNLELLVVSAFGDHPAVVYELPPVLEVWVHDDGHEVVVINDAVEGRLEEGELMFTITVIISVFFLLLLVEALQGIKQTLVAVYCGEVGDGAPILD